jgi:hypothetical protein
LETILAPLTLIFPGMLVARLLHRRAGSFGEAFAEGILWSLLIVAAPAWIPFGDRIPLLPWTYAVLALSALGLFVVLRDTRRFLNEISAAYKRDPFVTSTIGIVLSAYVLISLTRALIDWDAIAYYLSIAVQWFESGHVTAAAFPYMTTVPGTAISQPPLMPAAYTVALFIAKVTNGSWDHSVRLLPIVFVAGTMLCTRRIASTFLSPTLARWSVLLWLILPAIAGTVAGAPLYLDLGATFLFAFFVSQLTEAEYSFGFLLRLCVTASALAMFKIDGIVLAGLAVCVFVIAHFDRKWGIAVGAAIALTLLIAAVKAGFVARDYPPELATALVCCTIVFLACAGTLSRWSLRSGAPSALPLAGIALGFLPGLLYLVHLTLAFGSPAGYYIPAWAHTLGPAWRIEAARLAHSAVYREPEPPGFPGNFGPQLILWWGFSPIAGVFAFFGVIDAIVRKNRAAFVAGTVAACYVAFLTIFHFQSMRHLLPVTPLIATLALGGIDAISRWSRRDCVVLFAGVLLGTVPFTWASLQPAFSAAYDWLAALHWDQWGLDTPAGLIGTFVFALVAVGLLASPWPTEPRTSFKVALAVAFLACAAIVTVVGGVSIIIPVLGVAVAVVAYVLGILRPKTPVSRTALAVVFSALVFAPLVSAAVSPGLSARAAEVLHDEDYSYYPVLKFALDGGNKRLLTFKSYGVPWFSRGTVQRIDLADATDVVYYNHELRELDMTQLAQSIGVQAAVLPAPGTAQWSVYLRGLASSGLFEVTAFSDPLVAESFTTDGSEWAYQILYPRTDLPGNPQLHFPGHETIGAIRITAIPWQIARAIDSAQLVFGADLPNHEMQRAFLPVHMARDAIEITSPHSASLRAIVLGTADGHHYDFRSRGEGAPFLLRPEDGIVADIEATVDGNGPSFNLFPSLNADQLPAASVTVHVLLRRSPACPSLTGVTGMLEAAAYHNRSVMFRYPLTVHSDSFFAGVRTLAVSLRLPDKAKTIDSVRVTGLRIFSRDPRCLVSEQLEADGFSITRGVSAATPELSLTPFNVIEVSARPQ